MGALSEFEKTSCNKRVFIDFLQCLFQVSSGLTFSMFGFGKGSGKHLEPTSKRMRGSDDADGPRNYDTKKMSELKEQLKELRCVSRETIVAQWCTSVTRALLEQPDNLKGVMYRCQDNVYVGVHRFILGLQSTYDPFRLLHVHVSDL